MRIRDGPKPGGCGAPPAPRQEPPSYPLSNKNERPLPGTLIMGPESAPQLLWGKEEQLSEHALTFEKLVASDTPLATNWWRRVDSNH